MLPLLPLLPVQPQPLALAMASCALSAPLADDSFAAWVGGAAWRRTVRKLLRVGDWLQQLGRLHRLLCMSSQHKQPLVNAEHRVDELELWQAHRKGVEQELPKLIERPGMEVDAVVGR